MKRYLFCLTTHIAGIVLLTACALLAFLHEMWFCSITAVLLTVGTSFSLYRIQMRQTSMIQRIVECMKRNDFSQTASPSFSDRAMQELANDLSEVLKGIRNRMLDEEVKLQYYENLLDKVDTAVIVTDHQGRAEWMNKAARPLLGEHKQLPGQVLEALRKKQQVAHLIIQDLPMDLAIASSVIHLQGRERWIISLKNIHSALEHTEMEAWQKLIRVLTHEIMNSITPIISLAETFEREKPGESTRRTYPNAYTERAGSHSPPQQGTAGIRGKLSQTDSDCSSRQGTDLGSGLLRRFATALPFSPLSLHCTFRPHLPGRPDSDGTNLHQPAEECFRSLHPYAGRKRGDQCPARQRRHIAGCFR